MRENRQIVIVGAGGHGRVVRDIASLCGYEKILFLDDSHPCRQKGVVTSGKVADFAAYVENSDFIVAIGNKEAREKIFAILEEQGANMVSLVHPNAAIGTDVVIERGTVVMAGAVVNTGTVIGKGVIVNTAASIDHDCSVGDFSHVSVGSHLCGTVSVGSGAWIGAGATVINNISICKNAFVGAGAVVVKDIEEAETYVGVPARRI